MDELILLREEIPRLDLVFDSAAPEDLYTPFRLTGWQPVLDSSIGSNNRFWFYQNEIDVSGWGVKGLTFYPTGFQVQTGPAMRMLEGGLVYVYDIISQNPFDVEAYVIANINQIDYTTPGLLEFPGPNSDRVHPALGFEDILGGETTLYAHSAGIMPQAVGLPVNQTSFGSLEPTASDRLYVTRLVFVDNLAIQPVGLIKLPSSRFILSGVATAEPKLSYIMRLKNSFKLAQTDVGLLED